MTLTHTKPFDLNAAKAGATVGLLDQNENGYKLEILKYGDKKIFGILTDWNGCESAEFWQLDGTYGHRAEPNGPLTLVMLPLGYCEGKPVFSGDHLYDPTGRGFLADVSDTGSYEVCIWPKPQPKYPETKTDPEEYRAAYNKVLGDSMENSLNRVANLAIKRAIQDGDVFTKQQVTAVLEELRNICARHANPLNIRDIVDGTDWDAILKAGM